MLYGVAWSRLVSCRYAVSVYERRGRGCRRDVWYNIILGKSACWMYLPDEHCAGQPAARHPNLLWHGPQDILSVSCMKNLLKRYLLPPTLKDSTMCVLSRSFLLDDCH